MQPTKRNLHTSNSNTNWIKATAQTKTAAQNRAVSNRLRINTTSHIKLTLSNDTRYNKSNYTIHSKTEFITINPETRTINDKTILSIIHFQKVYNSYKHIKQFTKGFETAD